MNKKTFEYGIFNQNALIKDVSFKNDRTALLGTIVKIENVLGNSMVTVKFLKDDGQTWESGKFCCDKKMLVSVTEDMWPFIAAVTSPQERVKLVKNPSKCEKLMQISNDAVVGFMDFGNVRLGTVKYIGHIKGMGKGFGLQLHEKKPNNGCDGRCAGITYFHCLPGLGLFTTVERIIPTPSQAVCTPPKDILSDLDQLIKKNIAHIHISDKSEIPSTYKTELKIETSPKTKNCKSSKSLQDILDTCLDFSLNTNNDFDNNSILQPDDTYLIHQGKPIKHSTNKPKSEMDLIEAIGGSWGGTTSSKELEEYSNLKKSLDNEKTTRNSVNGTLSRSSRCKSLNPVSHLISGSKTLPKKSKLLQEKENFPQNGDCDAKLNRKVDSQETRFEPPPPGATNDLCVGSVVEISNDVCNEPLYGVVRWMGMDPNTRHVLVGVELEEEQANLPLNLSDGVHNGQRFFKCAENRGIFVPLEQCHKDSRFDDGTPTPSHHSDKKFGREMDCPIVKGSVVPLCMSTEEDVEAVCGKFRGIQGHHNSCYLDATLFAMFTFTAVFDSLLFRPKGPNDIAYYEEVQRVLKEEIVNPLRTNLFVRADRVMSLRKLLDQLSSVSGLTSEEKDPEEFLNSLLAQILKAEPFLKLSSGQEAYHYQLFVEKDDGLVLPTVQQLFEQSFLTSDIKLKEVPSCLIIQMPRFGKSYKMYPRIIPSQLLDVTDVIEHSPRQCTVCGKLAKWECKQCFGECGDGLESTAFCTQCIGRAHGHARRTSHTPKELSVPHEFSIMEQHCRLPRLYMELFAVVCIETSHYVAFVKCGVGHEAPWCFFDSMADRKGEIDGYNIPEMVACPDVSKWLSDDQTCRDLHENSPSDKYLPEHARRLLCDAYICMYQSPDVMMYR